MGGLTTYAKTASAAVNLGATKNESFLTANAGGGVKWFASNHVGLRVDYRFVLIGAVHLLGRASGDCLSRDRHMELIATGPMSPQDGPQTGG